MKIICPNLKNKEVKAEFDELVAATSEVAAYDIWSQNNGYGIDKAPNGEPSKLFSDLLEHYNGNRVAAIQAKAKVFSNSFKKWFDGSKIVDANGEPLVVWHHSNSQISEFSIEYENYFSTQKGGTKKAIFFTGTAKPKIGTVLDRKYSYPVFLKANTVIEKTGTKDELRNQGENFTSTINRAAKEADAVIFYGIDDNQELNQNIYVINNSNNIKSVDNQGAFSTQDNNIYYQKELPIDDRIERVSNMMLNKLLKKNRRYRPRSERTKNSYFGITDTISSVFNNITDITVTGNNINEILDNIEFELNNNFKKNILSKYKSLSERLPEIPLSTLNERKNLVSEFLKKGDVQALSDYSFTARNILFSALPKLFVDNKFKSAKQAFGYYRSQLNNPNSNLNKRLKNSLQQDLLGKYIAQSKLKKLETLIDFIDLMPDYKERIMGKVISETRRAIEYSDFKDRNKEELESQLTQKHRAAVTSSFDITMSNEVSDTNKLDPFFPTRKIVSPEMQRTLMSETSSLAIIEKIIDNGGELSDYAKNILEKAKKFNIKVALVTNLEGAAGQLSYTHENGVEEMAVLINYNSDLVRSNPEKVLLHEITHSLSIIAISNDPQLKEGIQKYIDYCESYLKKNSEIKNIMGMMNVYGFSDPYEFVSEFFTNKDFQNLLKEIPAIEKKTFANMFSELLDRLIKWITNSANSTKNAYEQFLPIAESILDYNTEITSNEDISKLLYENSRNESTTLYNDVETNSVYSSNTSQFNIPDADHIHLNPSLKKINKIYSRIQEGYKSRIKDVQKYAKPNPDLVMQLNNQLNELNRLAETEQMAAIVKFTDDLVKDSLVAQERINNMYDNMIEAISNGTEYNIPSALLNQLNHGYLGFYRPIVASFTAGSSNNATLLSIVEDKRLLSEIKDEDTKEQFIDQVKQLVNIFTDVYDKYNNLREYQARNVILKYAQEYGSTTLDTLEGKIDETDEDIMFLTRHIGAVSHANDEIIRLGARMILDTKNEVARKTLAKGQYLLGSLRQVAKAGHLSKLQWLHERNNEGKKTGFMIRPLNYGQYLQDKMQFRNELAQKHNLPSIDDTPTDPDQLKSFNLEREKWLADHIERPFTPEYYKLFAGLSNEAQEARQMIQDQLKPFYDKVRDENGIIRKENLSDADYAKVKALEKERSNLTSLYYDDGTEKQGVDKDIALELQKLNEQLYENVQYKTNAVRWNKALADAQKLPKDQYDRWIQRNTKLQVKSEFWDELAKMGNYVEDTEDVDTESIDSEGGKESNFDQWQYWRKMRSSLMKRYKDEEGNVDFDSIPDETKETIAELDAKIESFKSKLLRTKPENAPKFDDIAYIWVSPEYRTRFQTAVTEGGEVYSKFLRENTWSDEHGIHPSSVWTRVWPKSAKYVERVPNGSWSEVDPNSKWFNKNFDRSNPNDYHQPKKSLYDNSKAYNKVMKVKELAKLRGDLISAMSESNDKMNYLQYNNPYKLPQIAGGAWTMIRSKSSFLKGIGALVKDNTQIKAYDSEYNAQEVARRPDGSLLNFIPTRYMEMLDDPNEITPDIVGSIIEYFRAATNYEEMSKIRPDLELIGEQLAARQYNKKASILHPNRTEAVPGSEMYAYQKFMDTLDMQVYGKEKKPMAVSVFGINFDAGKILGKLANVVRITQLTRNLNSIIAGYTTNKAFQFSEAYAGQYYTMKDISNAHIIIGKDLPHQVLNWGRDDNDSKVMGMMKKNQITRSNREAFGKLNQSRLIRFINQNYWWGGYTAGDFVTKGEQGVAVYLNNRLYNGKFVNYQTYLTLVKGKINRKLAEQAWKTLPTLWDAYEMRDNLFVPKKEYEKFVDKHLENRINNTLTFLSSKMDGTVSDIDKTMAHANQLTALFFLFRNFMIINFQQRLKPRMYNYMTEMEDEGTYRVMWRALKSLNRNKYNLRYLADSYKDAKPYEKAAIKKVIAEAIYMNIGLFITIQILQSYADDDKKNWWKNETVYLARRTAFEIMSAYKVNDILDLLNSPTAATTFTDSLGDIYNATLGIFNGDANKKITKGPYKGLRRWQRSLIRMTPWKGYVEAQDPRTRAEWLKK